MKPTSAAARKCWHLVPLHQTQSVASVVAEVLGRKGSLEAIDPFVVRARLGCQLQPILARQQLIASSGHRVIEVPGGGLKVADDSHDRRRIEVIIRDDFLALLTQGFHVIGFFAPTVLLLLKEEGK